MSRPSSRASTIRPNSSLSQHAPLTPHGKSALADSRRFGGLSAKQVDKISSTIASVRKVTRKRAEPITEEVEPDGLNGTPKGKGKARAVPSGAFLESSSFAAAPLNSRLAASSPHRVQAAARASQRPPKQPRFVEEVREETPEEVDEAFAEEYEDEKEPLGEADLQIQEALIIEDLLYVLMGIEGQFIEFHPDYTPEDELERLLGPSFVIHSSLDPSLRDLAERVLPLATHYTAIAAFVERQNHLEYGLINHALCAAIRELLESYLVLIAQLEYQFDTSPAFTLQRLWLYVHPMLHKFSLVHDLVTELVALPATPDDGNESSDLDDDDSDIAGPGAEGLRAVLGELKSPTSTGPIKGGEVLARLERRLLYVGGDPIAKDLYGSLFRRASQPYAQMILLWISSGHLNDPHDELIIREDKNINLGSLDSDYVDEYWDRRYTLKDASLGNKPATLELAKERGLGGGAVVPTCLDGWKNKVLLAGKYLNVMRECGIEIEAPELPAEDSIAIDDSSFHARIDAAYVYANKTLLRLLIDDQQLLARLRSVKHHFFIDCGDAFTHFLDQANRELLLPAKRVNLVRLQGLLDIALRNPASASSSDPYNEDVKVAMANCTLTDWLLRINMVEGAFDVGSAAASVVETASASSAGSREENKELKGIEAFTIGYTVLFPLELVFSRKTLLLYQLIFRYLLLLRNAEQHLTSAWLEQAKSSVWSPPVGRGGKSRTSPALERWKTRAFALRTHMLAFVQQMYGFAVGEVLEPRWRSLVAKVGSATTVDQLLRDHLDFLNTCLKECMLTHPELLRLLSKLMTGCAMFTNYMPQFGRMIQQATEAAEANGGDWSSVDLSRQDEMLSRFEKHFYHHSRTHLDRVNYSASTDTPALRTLGARLQSLRPHH